MRLEHRSCLIGLKIPLLPQIKIRLVIRMAAANVRVGSQAAVGICCRRRLSRVELHPRYMARRPTGEEADCARILLLTEYIYRLQAKQASVVAA